MKFCTQCGRKLEDGELCMCSGAVAMRAKSAQQDRPAQNANRAAENTNASISQSSLQKKPVQENSTPQQSGYQQQNTQQPAAGVQQANVRQSTPQSGYQQTARQSTPQSGYQQQTARQNAPQSGYQQSAGQGAPQGGYRQNAGQGAPQNGYQQNAGQGASQNGYQQNVGQGAPQGGYQQNPNQGAYGPNGGQYYTGNQDAGSLRATIAAFKNKVGIGEPERNDTDVYERGMRIVPDSIDPDQDEIPVRQYNMAILRTRLKLQRAEGRLQVTNKRVLFRATGRSLMGRTTLQYEFDVKEIAGIEVRKDHRFSFLNLFGCLLLFALVTVVMSALVTGLAYNSMRDGNGSVGLITALCVILGIASVIPFFLVYKKFILKHLSLSAGVALLIAGTTIQTAYAYWNGSSGSGFLTVLTVLVGIIWIINMCILCFVPNLRVIVKNKRAEASVEIRRMGVKKELSGFAEVLPWKDTERAINELGALIHDIQVSGDKAIAKWKEK